MTDSHNMGKRVGRMVANAGPLGTFQAALVTAFVLYWTYSRRDQGNALEAVILVAAGLTVPYFFRDQLVNNLTVVRRTMNLAVVGAIICGFVWQDDPAATEPAVQLGLVTTMALYIGCFFWLMSDQRVIIDDAGS